MGIKLHLNHVISCSVLDKEIYSRLRVELRQTARKQKQRQQGGQVKKRVQMLATRTLQHLYLALLSLEGE